MEAEMIQGLIENVTANGLLALVIWWLLNKGMRGLDELKGGLMGLTREMIVSNLIHANMDLAEAERQADIMMRNGRRYQSK